MGLLLANFVHHLRDVPVKRIHVRIVHIILQLRGWVSWVEDVSIHGYNSTFIHLASWISASSGVISTDRGRISNTKYISDLLPLSTCSSPCNPLNYFDLDRHSLTFPLFLRWSVIRSLGMKKVLFEEQGMHMAETYLVPLRQRWVRNSANVFVSGRKLRNRWTGGGFEPISSWDSQLRYERDGLCPYTRLLEHLALGSLPKLLSWRE